MMMSYTNLGNMTLKSQFAISSLEKMVTGLLDRTFIGHVDRMAVGYIGMQFG